MAAVRIHRTVADSIRAHCVEEFPAECCGLVTAGPSGGQRSHRCRNIQDDLHGRDSVTHPRTSRTAYRMDDRQVVDTLGQAEEAGDRLIGIYHSHIDCDAYFSDEDKAAAMLAGEPAYPDACYIVISVRGGRVGDQAAYQYDRTTRNFIRVPLIPEA